MLRDERLEVDTLGNRYGVELFALEKVAAWPLCEELFVFFFFFKKME